MSSMPPARGAVGGVGGVATHQEGVIQGISPPRRMRRLGNAAWARPRARAALYGVLLVLFLGVHMARVEGTRIPGRTGAGAAGTEGAANRFVSLHAFLAPQQVGLASLGCGFGMGRRVAISSIIDGRGEVFGGGDKGFVARGRRPRLGGGLSTIAMANSDGEEQKQLVFESQSKGENVARGQWMLRHEGERAECVVAHATQNNSKMQLPGAIVTLIRRVWAEILVWVSSWVAKSRVRAALASIVASAMLLLFPSSSAAVSICLPVPTPSGVTRVCLDLGEDALKTAPADKAEKVAKVVNGEYVPPYINSQRTPTGDKGNVLTRMGFRPFTMVSEARDRIVETSKQRLEYLRFVEAAEGDEPIRPRMSALTKDHLHYMETLEDPWEMHFGVPNIPRSQIMADRIDPVVVFSQVKPRP